MESHSIPGVFGFETGTERTLEPGGRLRRLQAAPEEFGLHVSGDQFAWPEDAAGGREAQVFAFLARGLGEGPHREFTREIDRGAAG